MEDYPPYKIFISFIWVIAAVYLFRLFIGNHQIEVGSQAISLPDIYDSITPKNLSRTPGFVQVVVVPETVVDAEPNSIRPVQVSPAIKNLIQDQTIIYSHEGGQLFDRFFKALDQTTQEGLKTRILFYGDSQIEGGRIVSYLRQAFQQNFGGRGTGIISPVEPVYVNIDYQQKYSNNWQKYQLSTARTSSLNKPYGAGLFYAGFSGRKADFSLSSRKKTDLVSGLQQGQVHVINEEEAGNIFVTAGEQHIEIDIPVTKGIQVIPFEFVGDAGRVDFSVSGNAAMRFYGIDFSSDGGVVIDQFPQRGSAGLEFSHTDKQVFEEHIRLLNPNMIVLMYGINVVPADRSDFSYYRKLLNREIGHLKQMCQDIPILLVGVSDMAKVYANHVKPYTSVIAVNEAMRGAAMDSGMAFFDLLAFMGGTGSCISWVNHQPALMRHDHTHFTIKGGELVAASLYQALMNDYLAYQNLHDYVR